MAHFQPVTSPPDPQAVTLAVGETVEVLLHGGGISGTNLASPGSASPRQEVIVSRPLVDGGWARPSPASGRWSGRPATRASTWPFAAELCRSPSV